ncbi:MAG: hypothetical protein PHD81_01645 [Candidatus Nanoarchaeia archaeon]|nr:hypothetical protein [Candidatus Nanoarchaeia archaeon]MDD5587792.1 hypothetical protein [Candidatus Nanoarchaeia archaeon]
MFCMLKKRFIVFLNMLIFIPLVNAAVTNSATNMVGMIVSTLELLFKLITGLANKLIAPGTGLLMTNPMVGRVFLSVIASIILYDALKQSPFLKDQEGASKKAALIAILIGLITAIGLPGTLISTIFTNAGTFFGFIIAALILTIFKGDNRVSHAGKCVGYLALLWSFGAISPLFGTTSIGDILGMVVSFFTVVSLIMVLTNFFKIFKGGAGSSGSNFKKTIRDTEKIEAGAISESKKDYIDIKNDISILKGLVAEINSPLEQAFDYATAWENYFISLKRILEQIEKSIEGGRTNFNEESKKVLESLVNNCGTLISALVRLQIDIKQEIESIEQRIFSIKENLDKISKIVNRTLDDLDIDQRTLVKMDNNAKSLPDDIKRNIIGEIVGFQKSLADLKNKFKAIGLQNIEKDFKENNEILSGIKNKFNNISSKANEIITRLQKYSRNLNTIKEGKGTKDIINQVVGDNNLLIINMGELKTLLKNLEGIFTSLLTTYEKIAKDTENETNNYSSLASQYIKVQEEIFKETEIINRELDLRKGSK